MKDWKYCFPHTWERPRQVWEDVYLLPDDPLYDGPGLHVTVDALGNVDEPSHGSDRAAFQETALARLGTANFWTEGSDMIVRQVDFTREELLAWVRVWLEHHHLVVGVLREVPFEDFAGRIEHATLIADLKADWSRTRAERDSRPPNGSC